MGSIVRHSRSERFIGEFGNLFAASTFKVSDVVSYKVKEQGLFYDSASEVVRYSLLLAPVEGQEGPEMEVTLADWPVIFDPECYDRDDEIEQIAEMIGMDKKLVEKMFDKAHL